MIERGEEKSVTARGRESTVNERDNTLLPLNKEGQRYTSKGKKRNQKKNQRMRIRRKRSDREEGRHGKGRERKREKE